MLLLAINSATTLTEVALLEKDRILFQKSWLSNRDEAEKIIPTLSAALKNSHFDLKDLESILVINGPGSFSGLRIGITIANTLAFSQKIPVFTMTTFELLRYKISPSKRKNTAIILSAGGSHFAVLLPKSKKPLQFDIEKLADFFLTQTEVTYLFADLNPHHLEKLQQTFPGMGKIKLLTEQDTQNFAEALLENIKRKKLLPQPIAIPFYLEKPHITQSKKQTFT